MTGTVKLCQVNETGSLLVEIAYYRTTPERKRIVDYWLKKHDENVDNCYIQIAPRFKYNRKINFAQRKIA